MSSLVKGFRRFIQEEDAPTMVEYGLLVVVIALVVVVGAAAFGTSLSGLFSTMGANMDGAAPALPGGT